MVRDVGVVCLSVYSSQRVNPPRTLKPCGAGAGSKHEIRSGWVTSMIWGAETGSTLGWLYISDGIMIVIDSVAV